MMSLDQDLSNRLLDLNRKLACQRSTLEPLGLILGVGVNPKVPKVDTRLLKSGNAGRKWKLSNFNQLDLIHSNHAIIRNQRRYKFNLISIREFY